MNSGFTGISFPPKTDFECLICGFIRKYNHLSMLTQWPQEINDLILNYYPQMNGITFKWRLSKEISFINDNSCSFDSDAFDIGLPNQFFLQLRPFVNHSNSNNSNSNNNSLNDMNALHNLNNITSLSTNINVGNYNSNLYNAINNSIEMPVRTSATHGSTFQLPMICNNSSPLHGISSIKRHLHSGYSFSNINTNNSGNNNNNTTNDNNNNNNNNNTSNNLNGLSTPINLDDNNDLPNSPNMWSLDDNNLTNLEIPPLLYNNSSTNHNNMNDFSSGITISNIGSNNSILNNINNINSNNINSNNFTHLSDSDDDNKERTIQSNNNNNNNNNNDINLALNSNRLSLNNNKSNKRNNHHTHKLRKKRSPKLRKHRINKQYNDEMNNFSFNNNNNNFDINMNDNNDNFSLLSLSKNELFVLSLMSFPLPNNLQSVIFHIEFYCYDNNLSYGSNSFKSYYSTIWKINNNNLDINGNTITNPLRIQPYPYQQDYNINNYGIDNTNKFISKHWIIGKSYDVLSRLGEVPSNLNNKNDNLTNTLNSYNNNINNINNNNSNNSIIQRINDLCFECKINILKVTTFADSNNNNNGLNASILHGSMMSYNPYYAQGREKYSFLNSTIHNHNNYNDNYNNNNNNIKNPNYFRFFWDLFKNKCLLSKNLEIIKYSHSNVFFDMFQMQINNNQFILQICGLPPLTTKMGIKFHLQAITTMYNNDKVHFKTELISTMITFDYDNITQWLLPYKQNNLLMNLIANNNNNKTRLQCDITIVQKYDRYDKIIIDQNSLLLNNQTNVLNDMNNSVPNDTTDDDMNINMNMNINNDNDNENENDDNNNNDNSSKSDSSDCKNSNNISQTQNSLQNNNNTKNNNSNKNNNSKQRTQNVENRQQKRDETDEQQQQQQSMITNEKYPLPYLSSSVNTNNINSSSSTNTNTNSNASSNNDSNASSTSTSTSFATGLMSDEKKSMDGKDISVVSNKSPNGSNVSNSNSSCNNNGHSGNSSLEDLMNVNWEDINEEIKLSQNKIIPLKKDIFVWQINDLSIINDLLYNKKRNITKYESKIFEMLGYQWYITISKSYFYNNNNNMNGSNYGFSSYSNNQPYTFNAFQPNNEYLQQSQSILLPKSDFKHKYSLFGSLIIYINCINFSDNDCCTIETKLMETGNKFSKYYVQKSFNASNTFNTNIDDTKSYLKQKISSLQKLKVKQLTVRIAMSKIINNMKAHSHNASFTLNNNNISNNHNNSLNIYEPKIQFDNKYNDNTNNSGHNTNIIHSNNNRNNQSSNNNNSNNSYKDNNNNNNNNEEESASECEKWLRDTVKLPDYVNLFEMHGIDDLETLKLIKFEHLTELGIVKLGHKLKLMKQIQLLNDENQE